MEILALWFAFGVAGVLAMFASLVVLEGCDVTTDDLPIAVLMTFFGPFMLLVVALFLFGRGVLWLWKTALPSRIVLFRGRK